MTVEISNQKYFLLLGWVSPSLAVRESSNNLLRVRLLRVVTVALLGLDLVVRGSWVSSAPLRVPLGSTEEARMVLFRVGCWLAL